MMTIDVALILLGVFVSGCLLLLGYVCGLAVGIEEQKKRT